MATPEPAQVEDGRQQGRSYSPGPEDLVREEETSGPRADAKAAEKLGDQGRVKDQVSGGGRAWWVARPRRELGKRLKHAWGWRKDAYTWSS